MSRTHYLARVMSSGDLATAPPPPYRDTYPVLLCDGSGLELPLQPFPNEQMAIALLMSNQTPFAVEAHLVPLLVGLARRFAPEAIVGIPTLGLDYARLVAQQLGFADYVALGNSRKFWYSDRLAVPVVSVTSPDATKSLYLDPALVERIAGKRTLIVDDVINTGGTAIAAIQLLTRAGANGVGLVVTLTEGYAWKTALDQQVPGWSERVKGVGHIPLFQPADQTGAQDGAQGNVQSDNQQGDRLWVPIPDTL